MLEKCERNFYMYLEDYKDWRGIDFSKEKSIKREAVFPLFVVKSEDDEMPIGYVRIKDIMLESCCFHITFDVYSIDNVASDSKLAVIPQVKVSSDEVNIFRFILVNKESLIKITEALNKNIKLNNDDLLSALTLPVF